MSVHPAQLACFYSATLAGNYSALDRRELPNRNFLFHYSSKAIFISTRGVLLFNSLASCRPQLTGFE
jgi:hypothetical protein